MVNGHGMKVSRGVGYMRIHCEKVVEDMEE